jgi:hypothetical protein
MLKKCSKWLKLHAALTLFCKRTNFMKKIPSYGAKSWSHNQISYPRQAKKLHYHVHNGLHWSLILCYVNLIYTLKMYVLKTHFRSIIQSTTMFSKWSLVFRVPDKILKTFLIPSMRDALQSIILTCRVSLKFLPLLIPLNRVVRQDVLFR